MAAPSYDGVEVLIYDPATGNRAATRAALYTLGFRRMSAVITLDGFVEAVQRRPPDLALVAIEGCDSELCAATQQLRLGLGNYNPFMVIIVIAQEKNSSLIKRAINSGADDVLLRPFSTGLLGSRIEALIHRRKRFIVTSEYVGPDRRGDAARLSSDAGFDPPNSLRLKTLEGLPAEILLQRLDKELFVAREWLHTEKLRRDSFQVCVLWRMLQEQTGGSATSTLGNLISFSRLMERRARAAQHDAASVLCRALLNAAMQVVQDTDPETALRLLGEATLALHHLLHPDKSTVDQISEIDATVALIRARDQGVSTDLAELQNSRV